MIKEPDGLWIRMELGYRKMAVADFKIREICFGVGALKPQKYIDPWVLKDVCQD